jgi:hypothetical protein
MLEKWARQVSQVTECGMIVGAKHIGSRISETASWAFQRQQCLGSPECCHKPKQSSQQQSCGQKQLIHEKSKENIKNRES